MWDTISSTKFINESNSKRRSSIKSIMVVKNIWKLKRKNLVLTQPTRKVLGRNRTQIMYLDFHNVTKNVFAFCHLKFFENCIFPVFNLLTIWPWIKQMGIYLRVIIRCIIMIMIYNVVVLILHSIYDKSYQGPSV